jgi:hypothetical protein
MNFHYQYRGDLNHLLASFVFTHAFACKYKLSKGKVRMHYSLIQFKLFMISSQPQDIDGHVGRNCIQDAVIKYNTENEYCGIFVMRVVWTKILHRLMLLGDSK